MTLPHEPDDIDFAADAWARFERAVDAVSKSGPQHRHAARKPISFVSLVEELRLLLDKPGVPEDAVESAFRLLNNPSKCLFVSPQVYGAPLALEGHIFLQPSNLFRHFVSAFRASDWKLVGVIEHSATS